jgi:UDP-N-acetylmuramate--alanine ligase
MRKRVLTYGFGPDNHLRALDLRSRGSGQSFVVEWRGVRLGTALLGVPGRHNALNALAALAVGLEVGVDAATCLIALEEFEGVARRFEVRGEVGGVVLVDDYGHHPTEMAALLATAREVFDRRIVIVFQPHRYSRTKALAREFADVLKDAGVIVLADIYAAGERPIAGVSADLIVDALRLISPRDVVRVQGREDAPGVVAALLQPGDLLLTVGAGDVSRWGEEILGLYAARLAAESAVEGSPIGARETGI